MKVWIDKCYCIDVTFEALVAQAQRDNLTLPQLAQQAGCGLRCGWCVAYLRRALRTGETGRGCVKTCESVRISGNPGGLDEALCRGCGSSAGAASS